MSFEYYKKYEGTRPETPKPNKKGKKSVAKPVVFTESTKKRKRKVFDTIEDLSGKSRVTRSSSSKTPSKPLPSANSTTPSQSQAKTLHSDTLSKTPSRLTSISKESNPTTKSSQKKTPISKTPSKNASTPSRLTPILKEPINPKPKKRTSKKKKLNPVESEPIELRLKTLEEFRRHFGAVTAQEFERIGQRNPIVTEKVSSYLGKFLSVQQSVDEKCEIPAFKNYKLHRRQSNLISLTDKYASEVKQWEALLGQLITLNTKQDSSRDFVESGVKKFSLLKRSRDLPYDVNTKELIEDMLLQSDSVLLQLNKTDAFLQKSDTYFSSIANIVREKEFPIDDEEEEISS